ncbi:OprD family porin [Pseudomonas sp. R5(2019)]|uniref:OprD family porin n=1 Tax=Pseudomonas sp. R5(2019) TaxID=2697566 RepID=UPI001412F631|nr:OprD family porin [Pseudomonas sp. R5(2019)]NBA93365.1 outer membrane porin, OprD family [Pseudomonas sp. R5(2019)]
MRLPTKVSPWHPWTPAALILASIAGLPLCASADFVEDAKVGLTLRNYYFNRNYVDDQGPLIDGRRQGYARHWSQNLILDARSGYTEGALGFGVDALGLLSLKLDGDKWSRNTQMTPIHDDGYPPDDWGRLGLAGKMRLAETEVKVGEWATVLPVLRSDDGRSLPQTFQGGLLTSRDIESATLYVGQLRQNSPREDGSLEDFRFLGAGASDRFNVAGAEYSFNERQTMLGAWFAELEDIYDQRYYQLVHSQPVGDWVLGANVGYFNGSDNGKKLDGELSNETYTGMFSARHGNNTLYLGLMKVRGNSKWMRVNGASGATVANDGYSFTADAIGERSWQLRHDYDMAGLGIPGLTVMNRYIRGWDIDVSPSDSNGEEWIRESELAYTIQSGSLKDLTLKWRSTTVRRDFDGGQDFGDDRLIIIYPWSIL